MAKFLYYVACSMYYAKPLQLIATANYLIQMLGLCKPLANESPSPTKNE